MKTTKLQRDKVISVVDGKDLVGLYLKNDPDNVLLECDPMKADALIEIWNDKNFSDKHFEAILAKNDIAREIKNYYNGEDIISEKFILNCLKTIEEFIGESNQPSIKNIIECKKYDL